MNQPLSFQEIIFNLQKFWADQNCALLQPYDCEVGAGTFHPATFLRAIDSEPNNACYVQPSRRPQDGRYGENPNRLQRYYQLQVVMKPTPENMQDLYLNSLENLGIDRKNHDIRFIEDDWESPILGAWGLGWEVWLDGMEISQFTYFQEVGGVNVNPATGEITYGLERIAMLLQGCENVFDIKWNNNITYGDIHKQNEKEQSDYNFNLSDINTLTSHFNDYEKTANDLLSKDKPLIIPAYEMVMKCSHVFNLLEARGIFSNIERKQYVSRIRNLSCKIAKSHRKINNTKNNDEGIILT